MRFLIPVLLLVVLGAAPAMARAATPGLPQPVAALVSAPNGDPLLPFYSDSGFISLSVDAIGTNEASSIIKVHKNAAGATVRKAFLFAASTGFSGYTPPNGDVTLDGTGVNWDPAHTIANGISSVNVESDVTSLVKPKVDAAAAGDVSFTVAELHTFSMDGEILAVILSDPTVTKAGSVALMYGAQQTAGDTFNVALANPVDKTDPTFALNLSLGISFGFQPSGQFSTVDVNGTRMTSSAGGQDDCAQKYAAVPNFTDTSVCGNGALITAGGIGDLNDNPPDPNATDLTCSGALGPAPRCDDELYNLLPFVKNGDTSMTFKTQNPSNDDNIFFAALDVRSGAALVGQGVVLGPTSATNNVGQTHTVTATVQDSNGSPISGVTVHFQVTSGPNAGLTGSAVTNASGKATFSYSSSLTGTDHIVASFNDAAGAPHTSNEVTKTWVSAGDTTAPTCSLKSVIAGPPKAIVIFTQDTGSGLKSIIVNTTTNASTPVPVFAVGTTSEVDVTSTKLDQTKGSVVGLTVTDVAGNKTVCDPVLATLSVRRPGTVFHTYRHLAQSESNVRLVNDRPGVRTVDVVVNGHVMAPIRLSPSQSRTIDVARYMRPGKRNTIALVARGRVGTSTTVVISD